MAERAVKALHNRNPGHDKVYVCRIDYVSGTSLPYWVVAGWGKAGRPKVQAQQNKGSFSDIRRALDAMNRLLNEKKAKGYIDVETLVNGHVNKELLTRMVDMTRCCNFDGTTGSAAASAPIPASNVLMTPKQSGVRKIVQLKKGK